MYNSSREIVRCLDSVAKQTSRSILEVIVVNDGSSDDSEEIVVNWIANHPKLLVKLVNQKNGGVSKARNTGLKLAKGNIVALLDSDDEWHANKIEHQLNILSQHPEIDLLACNPIQNQLKRFLWKKFEYINRIYVSDLIFKNYFQPSTVIMKRSIIDCVGFFDENQRYAEEGNYFIRIAHKHTCVLVNERLINYGYDKAGFGESGLSGNIVEMEKGEIKNLLFAYKNNFINSFQMFSALLFSLLKFSVRVVKVKIFK